VADTGEKLPFALSSWKKLTPLEMSLAEPPSAIRRSGVPVQGDRVLELRLEQLAQRGDRAELAGVADRHVAAVVVVPEPAGVLLRGRDG